MSRPRATRTSSSTRSAFSAMAAAEPAPAAVMTWARGSTTFPAAQTPGTLVRPVVSATTQPSSSTCAAEADEQAVVRDEAWRHEHRVPGDDAAVVQLDAAEAVVLDDEAGRPAFDDADGAGDQLGSLRGGEGVGWREVDHVVGPLADDLRMRTASAFPPSTPSGWSRTS